MVGYSKMPNIFNNKETYATLENWNYLTLKIGESN